MKKNLLLIIFICLFVTTCASSANTTNISDLFYDTLLNINSKPQKINAMIEEIQKSPKLVNMLKEFENEEELAVDKDINYSDEATINYLNEKILTDIDFTERIILNYGQSKEFAKKLAEETDIKNYLAKKNQLDEIFRKEIYQLLP